MTNSKVAHDRIQDVPHSADTSGFGFYSIVVYLRCICTALPVPDRISSEWVGERSRKLMYEGISLNAIPQICAQTMHMTLLKCRRGVRSRAGIETGMHCIMTRCAAPGLQLRSQKP